MGDDMLTDSEFKLLRCLCTTSSALTQRQVAARTGLSLGTVNRLYGVLAARGYLASDHTPLPAGRELLETYRVKNAVILAAGVTDPFDPLSYAKPKGLLKVRGDILIERQIRQLHDAGITDITVVVGYMKEQFFYLADTLGVKLLVNEDYYRYGNTASLAQVLDLLDNTYICSSDNFFPENVFEAYVYDSYYASVYSEGPTAEYCAQTNDRGRITKATIGGGPDAWVLFGQAYFSRSFSRRFRELLEPEFQASAAVRENLWEAFLIRHLRELPIFLRKYPTGAILEFDSLDELRAFDDRYLSNTDPEIFSNISETLNCTEDEIRRITPLKSGQTNTTFRFEVRGRGYVYRHPRFGSADYIHRENEYVANRLAQALGLDDSFIAMDKNKGWKISRYVERSHPLDYHCEAEVRQAIGMLRRLHKLRLETGFGEGIWQEIQGYVQRLRAVGRDGFPEFDELYEKIARLYEHTLPDAVEKCLCHCNGYYTNFLVDDLNKMYLIDWEYSAVDDPGRDYGTFICCSDYTEAEAEQILELYYGHPLTPSERRHSLAYIAISAYYWFLWAIYQESQDKPVGRYLYLWYLDAKIYGDKAMALYRKDPQHAEDNA